MGLSIKGEFWRRPNDTFGLAGIINGISHVHQEFFEAGGTGILAGDGNLSYGLEKVLETYYDFDDLEERCMGRSTTSSSPTRPTTAIAVPSRCWAPGCTGNFEKQNLAESGVLWMAARRIWNARRGTTLVWWSTPTDHMRAC